MILDIKNITCGYGSKKIVENFSTTIKTGEILCLLGPNGVDKTTLFKTILVFLQPMAGTVSLDDKNLASNNKSQLAKVMGYVPQAHNPPFPFLVIDVVVMGRTAHLGPFGSPSTKDIALAYDALEKLEITNLKDRIYIELSGGERQMVLIARALVQETAFIILDEPTSNLDFGNQVRVLKQVIALSKRNIGIVMTTHFPDHAFLCQGRVVLMERNNLFTSGTAHDVLTEKSLSNAYGIGVKITDAEVDGTILRSCSPII